MLSRACFCGQRTEPIGLEISQSCPTCLTHQWLQQESRNFSYPQVETITVRAKCGEKMIWGLLSLEDHLKINKTQMHFLFCWCHLLCTSSLKAHRILSTCVRKLARGVKSGEKVRIKTITDVGWKVEVWIEKWTETVNREWWGKGEEWDVGREKWKRSKKKSRHETKIGRMEQIAPPHLPAASCPARCCSSIAGRGLEWKSDSARLELGPEPIAAGPDGTKHTGRRSSGGGGERQTCSSFA